MAIVWRGRIDSLDDLEHGSLPQGAVRLQEGDTMEEVLEQSLRMFRPLAALVALLSAARLILGLNWQAGLSPGRLAACIAAFIILYILLIFAHEWIHALFYPRGALKEVWVYQWSAALVYCQEPVSRERFMVMSLAPAVLLGFVPFALWLVWAGAMSADLSILWMFMSWSMIFGGLADYYNFRNVRRQVPHGARVFNYGVHTYWYPPDGQTMTGGVE